MIKGVSGAALRTFIEEVDPNVTELCGDLNMPKRTFYDLYKKKLVTWDIVARIHAALREKNF